jgi:hypothetical protein
MKYVFVIACLIACSGPPSFKDGSDTAMAGKINSQKPGSSFQDSLVIPGIAAIFYEPDSLQLEKIRQLSEEGLFKATLHEFEYQVKYSNKILKRDWPRVKIVVAKNVRFLNCVNNEGKIDIIDLDTYSDAFGLIMVGKKRAVLLDMTNVETGLLDYLND